MKGNAMCDKAHHPAWRARHRCRDAMMETTEDRFTIEGMPISSQAGIARLTMSGVSSRKDGRKRRRRNGASS